MTIIKDTDIQGKRCILEDASDVGSITDIYVDTVDWRVTKFDVKLEKRYAERMGIEHGIIKKTRIPVRIHFLKSVGDVVHLKGNVDDLARSQKTVVAEAPPPRPAAPPPKPAAKPAAPAKPPAKAPPPPPRETKKPRKL